MCLNANQGEPKIKLEAKGKHGGEHHSELLFRPLFTD